MSTAAERLMPEPLLFALSLLQTFCEQSESRLPTARGWTLQLAPGNREMTAASVIPLTFDLSPESCNAADFAASCVNAAVGLTSQAAEAYADTPSYPELFAPALVLLKRLDSQPQSIPEVDSLSRNNFSSFSSLLIQLSPHCRPKLLNSRSRHFLPFARSSCVFLQWMRDSLQTWLFMGQVKIPEGPFVLNVQSSGCLITFLQA